MQLLKSMVCFHCIKPLCWLWLLLLFDICGASTQYVDQILPGLEGSPMNWADRRGWFLLSNRSTFSLGFVPTLENLYVLVVVHTKSIQAVWTANIGFPVQNDCKFVFDRDGNAYLENATGVVWSTNTGGKGVTAMELQETGNLVLLGGDRRIIWQSFSHPTDTLLSGQKFVEGMKLKSFPSPTKLFHFLEIKDGDLILYAGYQTPQVYWSMANDGRKTKNNMVNGTISSASLVANSWNFYDQNRNLVWKFNFSDHSYPNAIWASILGTDGSISFKNLQMESSLRDETVRIPSRSCSTPEPCNPYNVCSFDNRCQCPLALRSLPSCSPQPNSPCRNSKGAMPLLYVGNRLDYFAIAFVKPLLKTNLNSCKEACRRNCSCVALFFQFQDNSGKCFLFDHIGSLKRADFPSIGFDSYVKVRSTDGDSSKKEPKHVVVVVIIAVATVLAIVGPLYLVFRITQRKKKSLEPSRQTLEEDNFLETVSGMPVRFSYNDLCIATKDFSVKLGQGGFGSVYQGTLLDGTRVAVKRLERIGQGMKEFKAEVSIIGSIHHVHLVRLRGFCAEGIHGLLVYEYMGKGSLDRWLFRKNGEVQVLDWETRFSIALGMAKGLAYLHEECDVKIVHCDIKPENVLLDDNFSAKVSDFGMAKLMAREQSHVFTEVRGTRGYLAPEWLTNYPISEKSDVFSFGMVVMELIGGRKNYEPEETSEKAHFPSYAFKMTEEGKLSEILDPKLEIDENNYDERVVIAIKVALWCVQDDMQMRPPMTKVVQMLEGLCDVPQPPTSAQVNSRFYSSFYKSSSEEGAFSEFPNYTSVSLHSDVQLSGPR